MPIAKESLVEQKFLQQVRDNLNKTPHLLFISPDTVRKNFSTTADKSLSKADSLYYAQRIVRSFNFLVRDKKVQAIKADENSGQGLFLVGNNYAKAFDNLKIALDTATSKTRRPIKFIQETGFDVGHTYSPEVSQLLSTKGGPQVRAVTPLSEGLEEIGRVAEKSTEAKLKLGDAAGQYKSELEKLRKAHATFTIQSEADIDFLSSGVNLHSSTYIIVMPQSVTVNRAVLAGRTETKIGDVFKDSFNFLASAFKSSKFSYPYLKHSPSFIDRIREAVQGAWERKRRKVKYKKKRSEKINLFSKVLSYIPGGTVKEPEREEAERRAVASPIQLSNLINGVLHDYIQNRMHGAGENSSINYLRYQTGTFAESARVNSILATRDGRISAIKYTYMRFPYDVFIPGNRFGSPGRDPRGYVSESIRQILIDNNVSPSGIVMELE